jgi:hypothetical protein
VLVEKPGEPSSREETAERGRREETAERGFLEETAECALREETAERAFREETAERASRERMAEREGRPTGAEAVASSAVTLLASIVIFAYLSDLARLTIAPVATFLASLTAALALFFWLRRTTIWLANQVAALAGITGCVFAWLLWLSWPDLLPLGGGADLAHHLQLIDHIERHWRLVHDASVEAYLGEMVHYTPGAHLLAAIAGRLTGTDGFHAVHPLLALSVALKAGFVFLIALRMLPRDVPRVPLALVAALLIFLPRAFFIGSFTRYSFFAQVVSETFAVVMWWALVTWDERPGSGAMAMFAVAGTAAFLTWPVWIGPPMVVLVLLVAARSELSISLKLRHLTIGAAPIVIVATIYAAGRLGWTRIAGTDADMPLPAWSDFNWRFLGLSAAGVVAVSAGRRGRATALLLAAGAAQAAALFALAKANGASVPYMAIKMAYLAIYPLAASATLAIALVWRAAGSAPGSPLRGRAADGMAWMAVAILAGVVGRQAFHAPMQRPMVSESLYLAGQWARAHVEPACVDYIVGHDNTAYWLHLAVLGNRRMSARTADDSTFTTRDAIIRWINPGGLPYAVADLGTLPRDVLTEVDELARFGTAVVIKRRGESSCDQAQVSR